MHFIGVFDDFDDSNYQGNLKNFEFEKFVYEWFSLISINKLTLLFINNWNI